MAGAAGRQHGALGDEAAARRLAHARRRRLERQRVHPEAPGGVVGAGGRHQLRREVVLADADVRVGADGGDKGALDLGARGVRGVDDAGVGVPALAGEVEGAGGVVGAELGAEAREVLDGRGALAADNLRGARGGGRRVGVGRTSGGEGKQSPKRSS